MIIVAGRQLRGSYGLLVTGEVAEVDDEVAQSLIKRGLAIERGAIEYQTKVVSPEEAKKRESEIARMMADFPAYAPRIEEARISGSPLHLVAAGIAVAEEQREAWAKKLADVAAKKAAKSPDPAESAKSTADITKAD